MNKDSPIKFLISQMKAKYLWLLFYLLSLRPSFVCNFLSQDYNKILMLIWCSNTKFRFTHNQECRVDRDAIGVRCAPNRIAHCRKDEISHDGQCYHLAGPDSGLNHGEALEYCTRRNARVVDITSQAENNFVSEWLLQSHPEVSSIMTSGFGFTTMNRTLWLWNDSARAKFK